MTSLGRALVVEDDTALRGVVEGNLREAAYEVEAAASTSDVAALARERAIVVLGPGVVSDRAAAVVRAIRRDEVASEAAILVLRHEVVGEDIEAIIAAGADDFARFPIPAIALQARCRQIRRVRGAVTELELERRDAQVMLELTQALASSLDFRDILYTVVRRIAEVVRVARVSIVLAPEPEQGDVGYVVVASDDEKLSNLRLDLSKYPEILEVLRTCRPLTIRDVSTHPVLDGVRADVQQAEHRTMSLFPIVWEENAIGVLFLRSSSEHHVPTSREAHFCQVVANATAVALRNARVMQSLRDHTQQVTFARFEAERRIRSLKRYADLFASAAEGIAVIDPEGRLLFANPRAYDIIGYAQDTFGGAKVKDLVAAKSRERVEQLWAECLEGKFPRGVDLTFVRRDGQDVICSCSFAALADGEGAVLISFQDVTEHRRTEAELVKTMEFLESLINASVDAIVAADMKGTIILFNQGAERIYGHRTPDVVGKMSATRLYPGEGAKEVMRRIRAKGYGGPGRLEPTQMEALTASGERIPIQISAAMIYERGEPVATFGIFTDLRERKHVEERLAQAQQKLAISERQALIAELAGTAAHELNQPLTSVLAHAELLVRKLGRDSPVIGAAETMMREAQRMAEIVRKIGQITKYETTAYVGGQKILDLDRASGASHAGVNKGPADEEEKASGE